MNDLKSRQIIEYSTEGLLEATKHLLEGNLIAFPTETVYGLGANALNEEAGKTSIKINEFRFKSLKTLS